MFVILTLEVIRIPQSTSLRWLAKGWRPSGGWWCVIVAKKCRPIMERVGHSKPVTPVSMVDAQVVQLEHTSVTFSQVIQETRGRRLGPHSIGGWVRVRVVISCFWENGSSHVDGFVAPEIFPKLENNGVWGIVLLREVYAILLTIQSDCFCDSAAIP